jgi:hypothetical protein
MVWHIYPQADAVHEVKLGAFLERYCAGQGAGVAAAVRALFAGWNGAGDAAAAWGAAQAALPEWTAGARTWAAALAAQRDLVSALVEAAENRL